MDIGQNTNEPSIDFVSGHGVPLKQKRKKTSATTDSSDNLNECFDCNICLDAAHDPVVTLCGHLYCWPCIYKWIQVQSSSPESDERPQCPICKAHISSSTLVPLYGRGTSSSDSEVKKVHPDYKIPGRPQAQELPSPTEMTSEPGQQHPNYGSQPQQHQLIPHTLRSYPSMAPSSFSGTTGTNIYSPTVWMFGEMVSATFFGNDSNLLGYTQPSSYPPAYSSPRIRRQEMQVVKSLNRLSIFFLCCLVLCLLLF
ncbi:ubiquitin-protein ligase [Lithospermum erythrorhizon]|uniref:E3 ubiquitin-protein ligase RMA n=1 Tax=Lithospermum erythrorhizon TaxID=34254 RepID=A0AAV3RRT3_LITER